MGFIIMFKYYQSDKQCLVSELSLKDTPKEESPPPNKKGDGHICIEIPVAQDVFITPALPHLFY